MAQAVYNPTTQQLDFVLAPGSIAPSDAQYWVATANATLTAERNLGLLTTGLVKNTVTTGVGVPSTAVAGTDYLDPTYISDTAYAGSWNGVTTIAPSKNAVYDKIELVQADLDGFPDELKNLTTAEIQQLENIGAESISATEWGYLAALNQSLTTSSNVQFNQVTASIIGNASTATALQTARAINGVNFDGSASITVNAVIAVSNITSTTQTMAVNTAYISNHVTDLVAFTLPSSAAVGDVIELTGNGVGGWSLLQNLGQTIHFGNTNTTTGVGGSLASTNRYDSVKLRCTVANTDFVVLNSVGNITIV